MSGNKLIRLISTICGPNILFGFPKDMDQINDYLDISGNNLLTIILRTCYYNQIVDLLINHDIDINHQNIFKNTPLMVAVINSIDLDTIKTLLDSSADPNYRNHLGWNSLDMACNANNIDVVKLLLKYGTSIENVDNLGYSTLMLACMGSDKNVEIIKLLIESNVDVNLHNGYTALMLFCRYRNFSIDEREILFDLILRSDLSAVSVEGHDAFWYFKENKTSNNILEEHEEKIFSGEIKLNHTKSAKKIEN